MSRSPFVVTALLLILVTAAPAQQMPQSWADGMKWRAIGPATMGGRIIALAVYEKNPSTWWAATASGGLLKTTNNGTSFEHQFDREATVSIGHVAVAQSDPNIVWVGTGEANPRNSVSYGDGVYKSTDGGKTWKNMGLRDSFQTGRIAIHPTDPNTVYVGALGRLYGHNEERGLFKTTDGGETWTKVLYVDDKTGVIDVDMHPKDPNTLMVATYERQRDGFDTNDPAKKYGPGSGIWKTTDGGETWKRIRDGLPTCNLGRVGIDWFRGDPNVLMAVVESEMIAKQPEDAPHLGARFEAVDAGVKVVSFTGKDSPAEKSGLKVGDVILSVAGKRVHTGDDVDRENRRNKAGDTVAFQIVRERKDTEVKVTFGKVPEGTRSPFTGTLGGQAGNLQDRQGPNGHEYGGIYKSTDGGETWKRVNSLNPRPMYYSQIRIDPSNANNVMVLGTSLYRSTDGGTTFQGNAGRGIHVDHHAQWIDPNDGDHIIHGCDGGIYVTYDACKTWDHLNHVAIGQFYHVGVSPERNYRVYGGLQDNGSWGGPSRTAGTGATNEDWVRVGGGDGFRCLVDPDDPSVIYSQSQNGPPSWRDLETGERGSLRQRRGGRGGRGGRPTPGERRERTRFNWETPYLLSGHNSKIVYTAGNKVFKSLNRGANMRAISPNITNTDRGSATALAESPKNADIVYVGTDDGALWVTRDGGDNWIDCYKVGVPSARAESTSEEKPAAASDRGNGGDTNGRATARGGRRRGNAAPQQKGLPISALIPGPRWVSEIVASQHEEKRAYVTIDGHRSDDDACYAFITDDAGETWRSLTKTLPKNAGSARTIAEDPVNPNLLWLGTEFQTFVSLDKGANWTRFNGNLPTVAVHAFGINVPSGEIVAGTHGRSLWITNVNAVRQMTEEVMAKDAHLYRPISAIIWRRGLSAGGTNRRFVATNPPAGAQLTYHLNKDAGSVSLEIVDGTGAVVRKLDASAEKGLHTVTWDLRKAPPPVQGNDERARRFRRFRRGQAVRPGTFVVRLTVDGVTQSQPLVVEIDPDHPDPSWITFQEEAERLEEELGGDEEEEHDR